MCMLSLNITNGEQRPSHHYFLSSKNNIIMPIEGTVS